MSNTEVLHVRDEASNFETTVFVPTDLTPYTKTLLCDYIVANKEVALFAYNGYYKYTFDLKSEPFSINGSTFVLECTVGGNADDIYRFTPENTTLAGDLPDNIVLTRI